MTQINATWIKPVHDHNNQYLITQLLKSVSRSFYLSLRVLPKPVRAQLSLAYLLARITDTLADTRDLPLPMRLNYLDAVKELILHDEMQVSLTSLITDVTARQTNPAEKNLILHLEPILQAYRQLDAGDKLLIKTLMTSIIEGQRFDSEYFVEHAATVTMLKNDGDLDHYIYLVAGCVGEFWSKLCYRHLPRFANLSLEQLIEKGIHFGKALQLTNILRDIPEDLQLGRVYIPLAGVDKTEGEHAWFSEQLQLQQLTIEKWRQTAYRYLRDAWDYCEAVNNKRLRFACLLPCVLAHETLDSLQLPDYLQSSKRVKVSRGRVYQLMIKIIIALFIPSRFQSLRRQYDRL